jgi:hypothetical protein
MDPVYCNRSKWLIIALLSCPLQVYARTLEIPMLLEQGFMQRLLVEQVYTEPDGEARVWDDGKNCNSLTLSAPVLGIEEGRVRTRTAAKARVGTALTGICIPLIDWDGYIEVFQRPSLSDTPGMVEFTVVDSRIYKLDGESRGIFGVLWDWIKDYVHPRFNRLRLNLAPILNDLGRLLELVFPHVNRVLNPLPETVSFANIAVSDDHIQIDIRFAIPEQEVTPFPLVTETGLTGVELARWELMWQQWDAFLTTIIKQAGLETDRNELVSDLFAVMLDARQDIIEIILPSDIDIPDPVPELFVKTWEQLAPVIHQIGNTLPTRSVINYLGFITAADALIAIQAAEVDNGFELNAAVLRHLVRMFAPAYNKDPLLYDTKIDPEIRALFGFSPGLPPPQIDYLPFEFEDIEPRDINPGENEPEHIDLSWLSELHYMSVPGAFLLPFMTATKNPYEVLVSNLNGWVPTIRELNKYLPQMQLLLDYIVHFTLKEKKLDASYKDLYRPLVLSTAWQESCWRQHIKRKGEITPILSHAGAVGIMQVNQHVWRGFYDPQNLQNNVGYNAHAGSEIVYHYLVDYAIARREHEQADGTIENLARATYAMYNGGPRHISRYRREDTPASLRKIDAAFWNKFQTIQSGNILAVAECYSG